MTALTLAQQLPDKSLRTPLPLRKAAGTPEYTILNVNNFTSWHRADGLSNYSPSFLGGGHYPGYLSYQNATVVIYRDGFLWGAKAYQDAAHTRPVYHLVRVGGSTYSSGTNAGWVTGFGASAQAADPADPSVRIYRIRRNYGNYKYGNDYYGLNSETEYFFEEGPAQVTEQQRTAVLNQYDQDWNEWPVDKGAPYIERNGIPGYQPPPPFSWSFTVDSLIKGHYDEPGIAGESPDSPADQVVWTASLL